MLKPHLAINLLPIEFTAEQVKRAKFYKIQVIGVGIILVMVFLASLTVALRVLQGHAISQIQAQLTEQEQKISGHKKTETSLYILKNRLISINQYAESSSKSVVIYKLLDKLFPTSVSITSVSIDKTGDATIVAVVSDSLTLDTIINSLSNKDSNEDKISEVSINSLNRGRDGIYRVSFKIKAK